MSQLDNFRESLQRRDILTDEENGMRDVVPCRKEMRFRRASIGLSGELHATIKALSFWMKKNRSEGESEDDGCARGDAGGILQAVSGSKEVYGGYLQIV